MPNSTLGPRMPVTIDGLILMPRWHRSRARNPIGNGALRIFKANWHEVLNDQMNCAFLIKIDVRPFRVMRHLPMVF